MSPPPGLASGHATVFGFYFPEILEPQTPAEFTGLSQVFDFLDLPRMAERLLEAILARAEGRDPVLVLPSVDAYPPVPAFLLEQLIRSGRVRIIATAHRLSGAADRFARDPHVRQLSVASLSMEESEAFLSQLLGVGRIESATLHRWYEAAKGNSYALAVIALSRDGIGCVHRSRGCAWADDELREAPEEFADYVRESFTEDEYRTLEMIAQAEPMIETALLKLLDPEHTSVLLDQGLVVSRRHPSGMLALVTAHPVLAASVRDTMPPSRRMELCAEFFRALDDARLEREPMGDPQLLTRLVVFGLECGEELPAAWLSQALRYLKNADPRLIVRLALEIAVGSDPVEAALAALRAIELTRLLGDEAGALAARSAIRALLEDPDRSASLSEQLTTRLRVADADYRFWAGEPLEAVLGELRAVEQSLLDVEGLPGEIVRVARFSFLAYSGRLLEATAESIDPTLSHDMAVEWARSPARMITALILQQEGRLSAAIRIAADARQLSVLGFGARIETTELQGFTWFLGYWASGSTEAGKQILLELEERLTADVELLASLTELVDAGRALFMVQEARWTDAVQLLGRLLERLSQRDGYGIRTLLHAAYALALAALGEREAALRELRNGRDERVRGLSLAVSGFRRRLLMRAQQWLRVGVIGDDALDLAAWARSQRLALVEIEALHIAACESRALAAEALPRAAELSRVIDPPFGEVILSHIGKIAAGASATDTDEPELRLLSELGLWAPLPQTPALSAREREIALFAALGYSSRSIAERLFLSVRTVDTHLGHVYLKVDARDREGLRRWFAADRGLLGDA